MAGGTGMDLEVCHPLQVAPPPRALEPPSVPQKTLQGRRLRTCCHLGACPLVVTTPCGGDRLGVPALPSALGGASQKTGIWDAQGS